MYHSELQNHCSTSELTMIFLFFTLMTLFLFNHIFTFMKSSYVSSRKKLLFHPLLSI